MNILGLMPRLRSFRVRETKAKILTRIREGYHRPGDRFLSNRAVARTFGISFQTAQRLIAELCDEGWLIQKPSSGTYIAGAKDPLKGVQLMISQRTNSLNGVIARLFRYLTGQLDNEQVHWITEWVNERAVLKSGYFPVFCDCPAFAGLAAEKNYALLLDDAPPPGLDASYIDSIAADDFSGGACAAQLFLQRRPAQSRYAILSGPTNEVKSVSRVAGFRSILPQAKVISANSWFYEDGLKVADKVLKSRPTAVFCCNDLLAKAVITHCQNHRLKCPALIGFDNDPVAEELNLTSIEIPESKMVNEAFLIIKKRMAGDSSSAIRQIHSCRPVVRGSW